MGCTIILPSSASRDWRVTCTVAIIQELQQIQIKRKKSWGRKRGIAENKTIRWGGYGMEVRKASFIPVTSIRTPLHHRLGEFGDFWDFLWGRSIYPGAMGTSERSKWSEDSAFEQAEAQFSVVTWGLTGFSEWTLIYISLHGSTLYICRSSTLQDSNSDDNTHTKVVIGQCTSQGSLRA